MELNYQTHVEVDLKAIQYNAELIKDFTGKKLIAVVKADAYGHGAVPVAETLQPIVDMFAVATVEEGIELRHAGIHIPILILFSPLPDYAEQIVTYELTPAIDNWTLAEHLNEVPQKMSPLIQPESKVKVHVDINTGMNRCGIHYSDTAAFLQKIKTLQWIEVEGVFTHFATADDKDKEFASRQLKRFSNAITDIPNIPMKHTANSAATLAILESYYDAIRPGLILYGIYPAEEKPIDLQPTLTWKTCVAWVDSIDAGEGVSYGLAYMSSEKTRIAGLQVGYGDGYPRSLSGVGEVLIGGKRRKIVGRICMDMMVVKLDPSDNVSIGDEVVLIGNQGEEEIGINEIAKHADTISYEILTGITKRVKRVYLHRKQFEKWNWTK